MNEDALAITSSGEVLVNLALADGATDPQQTLALALASEDPLFIGVVVSPSERRRVRASLDNASQEVAARLLGRRAAHARSRRTI